MLLLRVIWAVVRSLFSKKAGLVAVNLALRQQLIVLRRKTGRPWLRKPDRIFWLWLARSWSRWRDSLIVVTLPLTRSRPASPFLNIYK